MRREVTGPIGRRAFIASGLASAALLATGCTSTMVGVDPPTDHGTLFDVLWSEVDRRYPAFALKGVDWAATRALYRPRALAARTPETLAVVLGDMLAELRDMHVSLTPFGVGSTLRYTAPSSAALSAAAIAPTAYLRGGGTATARLLHGTLDDGVGYLRIPSFHGEGWGGEVDVALASLGSASRLVVDVRGNGGGIYDTALSIAGRFTTSSRRFGYLQFRDGPAHTDLTAFIPETLHPAGTRRFDGPVVLLVDDAVYSAAETFTLAMRARGDVTVVGTTTGGASGGPTPRELPNGWVYQLSEWIEYTLDRTPFEGTGLAPDVVARGSLAEARAGRDVILEQGLEVVRAM